MTKRIEFHPPSGLAIPEGLEDGEDFSEMATFRKKGQMLCLVSVGDAMLPGYDGKDKTQPDDMGRKEGRDKMVGKYNEAMSGATEANDGSQGNVSQY